MTKRVMIPALVSVAAVVALGAWQVEWDVSGLESWSPDHALVGAAIYVVALAASVVLLPFSSLPLLPLTARV
jgi:hypothetical protein